MLARDVRTVTGYDRVMVYRFDAEWNGEVIAEDRRPDLEPFFGLRYPASDIPAQARALYATNWMRIIPDATLHAGAARPAGHRRRPLADLSGAMLRSVSPVHLEYLANMGVDLVDVGLADRPREALGPHRLPPLRRAAPSLLHRPHGRGVPRPDGVPAAAHQGRRGGAERRRRGRPARWRSSPARSAAPRARSASALTDGDVTALGPVPAAGAALRINGQLHLLGTTPPADRVVPLVRSLLAAGAPVTDAASRVVPAAADLADTASGVLAVEVSGGRDDFLAWFRPETLREVTWGGNPYASKTAKTDAGPRLSPRHSFDAGARPCGRPRSRGASTRSPPPARWPASSRRPR